MSQPAVFYSWQSDTPRESTRDIARSAIEQAVSRLANGFPVEDSPRIDHEVEGQSGTPSITETIFHKIKNSAVLIADVTLVGATHRKDGKKPKKIPNPNVLLELGYGAALLGWQRIILLLNKHYGSPESLPFDLKFRRFPITYDLSPNSVKRQDAINYLGNELERAIYSCLAAEHQFADEIISKLSSTARSLISQHSKHQNFYITGADNAIFSRLDMAIAQLLDLGIVRCVKAETDSGFAYVWTYLGSRCAIQMGLPIYHIDIMNFEFQNNSVLLKFSGYDFANNDPD